MDELLGIDLIDCAGDNLAAIAPMVIFPASADKRVVTRYGEVTSASFVRPSSATYSDDSGTVLQVGENVPRVGDTGWILEGGATNKVTAAKSNPSDLTNITKSGDAAAVLSVVNDAAELAKVGLSAFGPNVYKLDNSAGTIVATALCLAATGNTNIHSLAVFARKASGNGSSNLNLENVTGGATISGSGYVRYKWEGKTPVTASDRLQIRAGIGDTVYFTLPQLEEGSVCTSPIPGGTGAITRASEGADTSGNGLSIPLSQAMVDSLKGEIIDWSTAGTFGNSGNDSAYITVTLAEKKLVFSGTYASAYWYKAGVVIGQTYEINYTITGRTTGIFRFQSGNETCIARSSNGTFTERITCLSTTTLLWWAANNFDGTVVTHYVRRVLDSGQTNPGEGTVMCGVYLPWPTLVLTTGNFPIITPTVGGFLYLNTVAGPSSRLFLYDNITIARLEPVNLSAGPYVLIAQFSAITSQMRAGLYNPTTGALTWGSWAAYRGFFPIHSSNQLCFFYGGGDFPIHVEGLRWLNSIGSDAECVRLSKEMLP